VNVDVEEGVVSVAIRDVWVLVLVLSLGGDRTGGRLGVQGGRFSG
jgi:hypothetical protein